MIVEPQWLAEGYWNRADHRRAQVGKGRRRTCDVHAHPLTPLVCCWVGLVGGLVLPASEASRDDRRMVVYDEAESRRLGCLPLPWMCVCVMHWQFSSEGSREICFMGVADWLLTSSLVLLVNGQSQHQKKRKIVFRKI